MCPMAVRVDRMMIRGSSAEDLIRCGGGNLECGVPEQETGWERLEGGVLDAGLGHGVHQKVLEFSK